MWQFELDAENKGYKFIAGVDEAGRGPLAGPVVSAAVILPSGFSCESINDSKKLTQKKREALFPVINQNAVAVATGIAYHHEIDEIDILQASLLSMKRAVEALNPNPDFLLIDGTFTLHMNLDQTAVIKGDSKSISVAAASIIAKVTRDAIMRDLHEHYPQYNFIQNKGYPTKAHKQAIIDFGPSPVHRKTFKGVKEVINDG
jgi:ribonuclease HII